MRVSASFLIPLALIAAGLAVRVADPVPIQTLRGATFDLYQRLLPRSYVPGPVRVIDIDDESLRRIGQWPWPRTVIAQLIEKLQNAGAAAIAFDIVFAEADRTSPSRILPFWPKTAETQALRVAVAAGRLPDHDRVLADTIARGKVVTGFAFRSGSSGTPVSKAGIATLGPEPLGHVPRFDGALTSLDEFQAASAGNGALTMIPDSDGVLRRVQLLLRKDNTIYPTLAAEALRVAQGSKTFVARAASPGRLASLVIGEHNVPTDSAGQIRLYDSGPISRRTQAAWRILAGDGGGSRTENYSGAIVFIGSSALGIEDVQHSPLSTVTHGVAIHAQAVEQILSRDYIFRPDWAAGLEMMAAVLIGVTLILILRRVSAWTGFALAVISISAVLAIAWMAFAGQGLLLAPVFTVAIIVVVYLSCTVSAYLVSERQRREVRAAFGQYLSPALIQRLAANPGLLSLGGDMREVTILFCDIRGFTALSERLGAEELTRLVNRFLTAMSGAILDSGGTIDKYIGDCVMAFWNAPLDDPAHARQACNAALSMRARLRQLNEELRAEAKEGAPSFGMIEMGVGINTGQCCVGNMGSEQRFNYSVLGDSVNLAARFEEETKNFRVDLVIGESTRRQVPDLEAHELGRITVRGRSQPVGVFTLPEDDLRDQGGTT
jgi:adenylate cyclase